MSEAQPAVVLVTARVMPRPVTETALLIEALRERGVDAAVLPWDEPLDWSTVPLVVLRTPWDYSTRHAEFVTWLRAVGGVTRLLNPAEVAVWNSHKGYLLELAAAGLPVVPTVLLLRGAGADEQAAALDRATGGGTGEAVVKPAVSVGAIGTLRCSGDEAREHLAELVANADTLVQPFVASVAEAGETSLIYFGGAFSHAVRKVPARGDFRVHEHHGGSLVAHTPTPAELAAAAGVLAAAPAPTAYARIDLVDLGDGPALMEAELIEPELFLGAHPDAAGRLADVLLAPDRSGAPQTAE